VSQNVQTLNPTHTLFQLIATATLHALQEPLPPMPKTEDVLQHVPTIQLTNCLLTLTNVFQPVLLDSGLTHIPSLASPTAALQLTLSKITQLELGFAYQCALLLTFLDKLSTTPVFKLVQTILMVKFMILQTL
jgi:hypothetical protein